MSAIGGAAASNDPNPTVLPKLPVLSTQCCQHTALLLHPCQASPLPVLRLLCITIDKHLATVFRTDHCDQLYLSWSLAPPKMREAKCNKGKVLHPNGNHTFFLQVKLQNKENQESAQHPNLSTWSNRVVHFSSFDQVKYNAVR